VDLDLPPIDDQSFAYLIMIMCRCPPNLRANTFETFKAWFDRCTETNAWPELAPE
jgi:hypothetical protein